MRLMKLRKRKVKIVTPPSLASIVENDGFSTLCNGSICMNSVKVSVHMIRKGRQR